MKKLLGISRSMAVVILCFLLTVSTAFEYKLTEKPKYIHRDTGKPCTVPLSTLDYNQVLTASSTSSTLSYPGASESSSIDASDPISLLLPLTMDNATLLQNESANNDAINVGTYINDTQQIENQTAVRSLCEKINFIHADPSDLSKNELYRNIFYILTSTLATFIPLILLTTFNCFLVATVHRSHKIRHKMTNTRQADTSTAQENKVTVTLIAVVILFLVCQTPNAIQLIYTMKESEPTNMSRALNNLINFLVTLNAASNFLLYCALSDKYRKTVRALICGRQPVRRSIFTSSRYLSGRTSTSFFSKSFQSNGNFSNASTKTSNLSAAKGKPKKRFSITPEEYANLQAETARLKNPRLSITPSEQRKNSVVSDTFEEIPLQSLIQPQPSAINHSRSGHFLHPSPSETSLTRSKSLSFPTPTKHSPDCKENPNKF